MSEWVTDGVTCKELLHCFRKSIMYWALQIDMSDLLWFLSTVNTMKKSVGITPKGLVMLILPWICLFLIYHSLLVGRQEGLQKNPA